MYLSHCVEGGDMSEQRALPCPACGVELNVPVNAVGRYARCGSCQHRFQIPPEEALDEDDILSLINEPDEGDLLESVGEDLAPDDAEGTILATEAPTEDRTCIRLIKLDGKGALFEFPADYLANPTFRCSIPRLCLRCGVKTHLAARPIIYASPLVDRHELHTLLDTERFVLREPFTERLSNEQILERLPSVPNVPPPADQTMPYWMCDMCDPEGAIGGRIIENAKTGEKTCRLRMANPHRARDFLEAASGRPEDIKVIQERCLAEQEQPWDMVPGAIRQRLRQWYKPNEGENFLGYVADRSLSRTEEGMAGLIISDHRLISHSQLRHREVPKDQPVTLRLAMTREQGELTIETPQWKVSRMHVDREGIRHLRRALTLGGFQATWR